MFLFLKELKKKKEDELQFLEESNNKKTKKNQQENKEEKAEQNEKTTTETNKNKNNKNNSNSSKIKVIKNNKKSESDLSKLYKQNKENAKPDYKKKKAEEKELKKLNKKENRKLSYNRAFPIYYQLILNVLVFVVIINLVSVSISKGYTVHGNIYLNDGVYTFRPDFYKLYLNDYKDYKDVEKGDTIYVYYNKKTKEYDYSKKVKFFTFCLKGEVYRVSDYYVYIDFDFDNTIAPDSFYLNKMEDTDVKLKKFIGKYVIEEAVVDSIIYSIRNILDDIKDGDFLQIKER